MYIWNGDYICAFCDEGNNCVEQEDIGGDTLRDWASNSNPTAFNTIEGYFETEVNNEKVVVPYYNPWKFTGNVWFSYFDGSGSYEICTVELSSPACTATYNSGSRGSGITYSYCKAQATSYFRSVCSPHDSFNIAWSGNSGTATIIRY